MEKQGNIAPPPYEMPQQPPPQPQPQVISNTIVMQDYGPEPIDMQCPYCGALMKTRVEYQIGAFTWILCLFLGVLVCCCDCTKDALHHCPCRNKYLGIYKRL